MWETGQCPVQRKTVTEDLENMMGPAIVSLWNQGQGRHLAINNLTQKQACVLTLWACAHWELLSRSKLGTWHPCLENRNPKEEVHNRKIAGESCCFLFFFMIPTGEPQIGFTTFLINTVSCEIWREKKAWSFVMFLTMFAKCSSTGSGKRLALCSSFNPFSAVNFLCWMCYYSCLPNAGKHRHKWYVHSCIPYSF